MKVYAVSTIAILLVQLSFLVQAGDGKGLAAPEKQMGAERVRKAPQPPDGGEKAPVGSSVRTQPAVKTQKSSGEAGARPHSELLSKSPQESSKQKVTSKQQSPQQLPPKSKSPGSSKHLEGHGKFNTDLHSCPGIHSKTCQKPSDCDGCLGLYTCKWPRGKCGLKAVSKSTGIPQSWLNSTPFVSVCTWGSRTAILSNKKGKINPFTVNLWTSPSQAGTCKTHTYFIYVCGFYRSV